ncbi:hypothetical protein R1R65_005730 [Klebsiella oxytoca]|nr:hypothetical protein [Klebsiella oxytoca]
MANSLLYIACLFRYLSFAFCHGDGSGGVIFGSLLIGFGFRLSCSASVTYTKRASN